MMFTEWYNFRSSRTTGEANKELKAKREKLHTNFLDTPQSRD